MTDDEGERIQKVLARCGVGSRRVCDALVAEGRIAIDGTVAVLGQRVHADAVITLDGVEIPSRPDTVMYLLNKPTGVITTASDPEGRPTVLDFVPDTPRVFPVGRLDADTEGVLLLTNDGELANRIAHPSHGIEKEYLAEVEGTVSRGALRQLREGVELEDGMTAPAAVRLVQQRADRAVIELTIHEGRNRQVRRMCSAVGHPVVRLVRTRVGPLRATGVAPGSWRQLDASEIVAVAQATGPRAGRHNAEKHETKEHDAEQRDAE
ncbi:MAG: pseudouridine synthase [Acidimicrobiia bacterium]